MSDLRPGAVVFLHPDDIADDHRAFTHDRTWLAGGAKEFARPCLCYDTDGFFLYFVTLTSKIPNPGAVRVPFPDGGGWVYDAALIFWATPELITLHAANSDFSATTRYTTNAALLAVQKAVAQHHDPRERPYAR